MGAFIGKSIKEPMARLPSVYKKHLKKAEI